MGGEGELNRGVQGDIKRGFKREGLKMDQWISGSVDQWITGSLDQSGVRTFALDEARPQEHLDSGPLGRAAAPVMHATVLRNRLALRRPTIHDCRERSPPRARAPRPYSRANP